MEGSRDFAGKSGETGIPAGNKKSEEGLLEPVLAGGRREQGVDSSKVYDTTDR